MFVEERQQKILEILQADGKVSVESLADSFGVSSPTIRADLGALEMRRLLRRTHGGAIPIETTLYEPPFGEREQARRDEKIRIARAAAERVRDHETVLLDAGTTVNEMGRFLKEKRGLTIVTNSLPTAYELSESGAFNVLLIGGQIHPKRRATLGPLATEFLTDMNVDRAFLGVNGVSETAGYTVIDFDAVQVKRAMMARGREVIVVADHTKLGEAAFASIGPLSSAQVLVTDAAVESESLAAALDRAGVLVVKA